MKKILRYFPTWGNSLLVMSVLLAELGFADPLIHQATLPSGMTWCDDSLINGLLTQVNAFRAQNGVAALNMSTLGMKDAEIRATQFAAYMNTNPPGSPGFNPHQGWDTVAASLGYNIVSENLAYMSTDPAYIVYAVWQDSLHLAAMLAADANVAGVSCVYYNGTAYWTYEPGTCTGASCGQTPPGTTPAMDSEDWNFLTLINNYRAQNGAGPLQVSATLEKAALWMGNDMATQNYAGHTDSLGRTTGARLAAFNYPYTPWGENIAGGFSDAQSTFNQWLTACDADASGNCTYAHRANMLNAGFHAIGIARAYGANSSYGWYWVTDFGGTVDSVVTPQPVGSAPTISSFAATPASILAGQKSALSWSVSGATSISIDNGVGDVSAASSVQVTPGQTTTYTLTASNSSGSITGRTTVTVTAPTDTQPPTAPILNSAVAKSSTEVDLAWTASTDNIGVAGYQIVRSGSILTYLSGATLAYADVNASPNTTYTYAVRAYDSAGNYSVTSNSIQVSTPAAPVLPGACPAPGTGAFVGCYYNNITLSGSPVLVRTDAQINFDWGTGSPDPAVTPWNFSIRWQGYLSFNQGTYTFTAITSDGMRVLIDGNVAMDHWRDQPAYVYTFQQTLSQGSHLVTVEYYEHTGLPSAHLSWQNTTPVTQPPAILSFTASPSSITAGQPSTLSWSVNGAATIGIDNGVGDVSSATARTISPNQTTNYTLTAANSAGSVTARTTVTVTTMADSQPPTTPTLSSAVAKSSTEVDLAWTASTDNAGVAGYQVIRNGVVLISVSGATLAWADTGASANATYVYAIRAYDAAGNTSGISNNIQVNTPAPPVQGGACPGPATAAFTGCYFNNITLSGNPALVRTDAQINFDWGTGTPDPAVTPRSFSVRWQGYFNFSPGTYMFTALTSDGMRIYVDGNLVLDRWRDQPAYVYTAQQTLSQGSHLVTVEYYEQTGLPTAHVTWQQQY